MSIVVLTNVVEKVSFEDHLETIVKVGNFDRQMFGNNELRYNSFGNIQAQPYR